MYSHDLNEPMITKFGYDKAQQRPLPFHQEFPTQDTAKYAQTGLTTDFSNKTSNIVSSKNLVSSVYSEQSPFKQRDSAPIYLPNITNKPKPHTGVKEKTTKREPNSSI